MAKKEKKLKENPMIKSNKDSKKLKKVKLNNVSIEDDSDENAVKKFVIIVLVIAILAGGIYFLTEKFKKEPVPERVVVPGSIDYDKLIIGTLLNRPYDDYYVMIFNSEDTNATAYSNSLYTYMQKSKEKDYVKIYFCDLADSLNKAYYNVNEDNKSNPKAKTISELDLGDITLLRIKKGKITEYIEDYTTIQKKLK